MHDRLQYRRHPDMLQPLIELSKRVHASGLEPILLHLVFMRASQLNGCAYCMDMHSKDGIAAGDDAMRLFVLPAWRETSLFSPRERAALAWCEAVTRLVPGHGVPDEVYQEAAAVFSEDELLALNMAVISINAWNRLAIPFRSQPGHYKPGQH